MEEKNPESKDKKAVIKEIISWVAVFFAAFIIAFVFSSKVYAKVQVDQSSMENTLFDRQQLIEDNICYNFKKPERGDIITFFPYDKKGTIVDDFNRFVDKIASGGEESEFHRRYVKRVIGIEGDEIDIKDGTVYLNGEKQEEPYAKGITDPKGCELPLTVGKNQIFVMGDNRVVSEDSRELGLINLDQVEGKIIFRLYPFSKFGRIDKMYNEKIHK
jgi:signal peptidase I